jgi:hypothetical protein
VCARKALPKAADRAVGEAPKRAQPRRAGIILIPAGPPLDQGDIVGILELLLLIVVVLLVLGFLGRGRVY